MAQEDYTPLLIGAGALLILAKWGFGNIPQIPNPLPAIGGAIAGTADELTGGLQKDRAESLPEFLFELDVPFSDKRFPLAPGLVRYDDIHRYPRDLGHLPPRVQRPTGGERGAAVRDQSGGQGEAFVREWHVKLEKKLR